MTLAPQRQKLIDLMGSTVRDQQRLGNWRYVFARPQTILHMYVSGLRVDSDCSDGCRNLSRWAGLPDPAGNSYQDWGNSETITVHMPHCTLAEAEPGDIGTLGWRAGEKHAFMFWEKDASGEWLVWNHGRQGQPAKRRLTDELTAHAGMSLWVCRQPIAKPKPTPQDHLRSETGFFSWLAWALGEGDWRRYGKANRTVRPNVPAVIPLAWWKRRAQFLANRKRGNKPTS